MGVLYDLGFIVLFVGACVLLLRRANIRHEELGAGWPPPGQDRFDASDLSGEEIGFLMGGRIRAIQAAVTRLRVARAVTYLPETGKLVPQPRDPGELTPLAAAVLAAAAEGTPTAPAEGTPVSGLGTHPGVNAAVDRLGNRFDSSWRTHDVPPRHFVTAGWPVIAVGLVAMGWAVAAPPFRWFVDIPLLLAGAFVAFCGVVWCFRPPDLDLPWRRAVRRIESRNSHLAPAMRPSLSTYGPAAAALAVGLYGMVALESTDSTLAAVGFYPVSPALERESAAASGGGGSSGGCGVADTGPDSSGSSCGSSCGGGCGGGCGG